MAAVETSLTGVATGASAEVMSVMRAVDPSVRLAGLREPLDTGPRSPAG
jgi:hypothetical protein